jgi:hypothetical protein
MLAGNLASEPFVPCRCSTRRRVDELMALTGDYATACSACEEGSGLPPTAPTVRSISVRSASAASALMEGSFSAFSSCWTRRPPLKSQRQCD